MIDISKTKDTFDEKKDKEKEERVVQPLRFEDATGQNEKELFYDYNYGITPVARNFQSAVFKIGAAGWRLNSNGNLEINSAVPAAYNSKGTPGTITFSATHIYCCVAKDTWKRVAISSF